jgi:hypothetical protein
MPSAEGRRQPAVFFRQIVKKPEKAYLCTFIHRCQPVLPEVLTRFFINPSNYCIACSKMIFFSGR